MSLDTMADAAPALRTAAEGAGYLIMSVLAGVGGSLAERRRRRRADAAAGGDAEDIGAQLNALARGLDTIRVELDAVKRDLEALRSTTATGLRDAAAATAKRDAEISADLEEVLRHAHDASTQIAYLRGRFDERRPGTP